MPRVLAVADSDSYLKWTAATLAGLPAEWDKQLVLLRSPVQPSARQIAAALEKDQQVVVRSWPGLLSLVAASDPEMIMLGCTGPVVEFLSSLPSVGSSNRILITGLPGMSWPASPQAVRARRGCDVFIVHSRRERRDFTHLIETAAPDQRVALARLPFLDRELGGPASVPTEVVFAAQAQVPPEPEQRREILWALASVPAPLRAVVKLRARSGEQQTHRERWPYEELWPQVAAERDLPPDRIAFNDEPMASALARARALVTVSSTAALEAMARGIPTVLLSDFGVSTQLINTAFEDSGCLGTLADVVAERWSTADSTWLVDNYLHPRAEDDLVPVLQSLLRKPLRSERALGFEPRRLRQAGRLLVPPTARPLLRQVRRRFRRLPGG